MRLPGSHNTKDGAWIEVVCEFTDGPRYELDDLEEWMSRDGAGVATEGRVNTETLHEAQKVLTPSSRPPSCKVSSHRSTSSSCWPTWRSATSTTPF